MGEFRRTQSKVWWSHFPEDEDDEVYISSPSLLPGWGPGVPLSPDRGSPSNGSHKSQDSGFSDSESSPPNPKPAEESDDQNTVKLPETPLARIPRACLSRYKSRKTLDKCLNSTWTAGEASQVSPNLRLNQSDCVVSVSRSADVDADPVTDRSLHLHPLDAEEGRTSFVIESEEENEPDKLPKIVVKNDSDEDRAVHSVNEISEPSVPQDSTTDISSNSTENQTALFIPKICPDLRPKSPNLPPSPGLRPKSPHLPSSPSLRPKSPKLASPSLRPKSLLLPPPSPAHSRPSTPPSPPSHLSSWNSDLDLTSHLGAPKHCSTPKSVSVKKIQPWLTTGERRPSTVTKLFDSNRGPVEQWCQELRSVCEPECMTTLQSKALTADLGRQVTLMTATTTEAVRLLQQRTAIIAAEFSKLYRKVESSDLGKVGPLVQSLLGHISELLTLAGGEGEDLREVGGVLKEAGESLRTLASKDSAQQPQLSKAVTRLGHAFTAVVDTLLAGQIKVLVAVLEEPWSSAALLSALSALTGLGLEAPHLGTLMSNCGGVRALLTLCVDCKSTSVRSAALRLLATTCCSAQTIRQFEQGGGVEIISDILSDERCTEIEVTEAVSVLAQVTAPWVEDNHSVQGLTENLTTLVASLTRLVSNTTNSPTLLLTAAALCHLSLLEPQCVWSLLECTTAGTLLLAVRRQGPYASVFLQEQAAGLLANLAAVPEARPHLAHHRAVVALICFLQVRHSPLQSAAEIAASERLQHKSAIALSRLCSDPSVAAQVVELHGVTRLVRLCREERERNHSDGVLVACLAALRKIVANCGIKVVDELNARELVEPRLLDSFLLYSSPRQESYV